jgi:hypothetical protein
VCLAYELTGRFRGTCRVTDGRSYLHI